jgi:DNA segregation ATPase FtsK/SpoIIIE, S-DNA-T family
MAVKSETYAPLSSLSIAVPVAPPPPEPPEPREPELIRRQRLALRELLRLVADRARREPQIDAAFKARAEAAERDFDDQYQGIIIKFASDKEASEREIRAARESIAKRYKTERAAADQEFSKARSRLAGGYTQDKEAAKAEFQESRWTIQAVWDGSKNGIEQRASEVKQVLGTAVERIAGLRQEADDFIEECRLAGAIAEPDEAAPEPQGKDPIDELQDLLSFGDWQLIALKNLRLPRWLKGERLLFLFGLAWLVLVYPAFRFFGLPFGLGGCTLLTGLGGLITWAMLYARARAQVARYYGPLCQAVNRAEQLLPLCREQSATIYHRNLGESKRRYSREMRQANERYRQLRAQIKETRVNGMAAVREKYRLVRTSLKERRDRDWRAATQKYRRLRSRIQNDYEEYSRKVQLKHERRLAEYKATQTAEWESLIATWHEGLARIHQELTDVRETCARLFPAWTDAWADWTPADAVPPALRFGEYHVNLAKLPDGLPRDPRLRIDGPTAYVLPALLPFPEPCSLLVRASEEGRNPAVQVLQSAMYRLLTTLPPGKVRFTIIDPVGLGQNFASFMHLADYDEALVTSRIWTEAARIEQRLADLTEHMETVIQKYLRNQFSTIEEYNVHAGEVAEPYRILVVANFPANFTSEAARRLVSIMNSGPRCGVYTLLSLDTKQSLPQGFDLADLELPSVNLLWDEQGFAWQDVDFEQFPLQVDAPPSEELGTRLLHFVGERAKAAKRVEVPFEYVAPPAERWWTEDSRPGIRVPLGRVGATKRQYLDLGHGTAQHVLIAGKTGSGKSTLLHALISNLALTYSPQEVELYLVDFKKGVEFKTYANHDLPHARVVAIESEREFGLSVLQRLDAELRQRGERFRAVGAQDLASYREANGNAPLPRILLIVDEFQEFFVEDDKIAQEAALLLDRLVRQGRAFGLHILLGSQTLGGAYSLARATIDQMAVRIALQCSEVDGHLILSEDNSAARLLSRPGEAIYNDANGLVEGNNPFQVVWLADDRREEYLRRIQEMARERRLMPAEPQIVFEGNAPADVRKNPFLHEVLAAPTWPVRPRSLGEAIAIKDPTSVQFRSQSGSNLVIVGQSEEAALGILSTSLVSLAAQHAAARFCILDGSPDDAPHAGLLAGLSSIVPQSVEVAGWRDLSRLTNELASEVDRRQRTYDTAAPDIYILIYGLQRFRDLRRPEDDFSFSRPDQPATPAQQFQSILRDGPAVGVHSLVWCDSLNNLMRTVDRATLREFELRVLFQMSVTDSSNLIDSPLASKLGLYRAYFHSEEQGRLEKFRPYGIPPEEWLSVVREQLRNKGEASKA